MILQPPRERPTIYTNVYTTSTFLVKKYLGNNSAHQNKVQTLFATEILPSSTQRISQSPSFSEGIHTQLVDMLRSFYHK